MYMKITAVLVAAALLGACSTPEPPPPPPPPPPPAATSYMVFFDWDRSNLSPQALTTIQQAAGTWKARRAVRITATGHTDTSGPESYNMALSLRRANAVKDALMREGVPATSIDAIGVGESRPLVPTGDGVREPQNRRVEIVVGGGGTVVSTVFADPRSYCKALSDKWREFRTSQLDTPEAAAISKCEAGNYQEGIPTLENSLIANKIPLPAPGYRWPGRPIGPS
ncbi:OmpA family protein [Reyranella sp.]|uniref:OmpA family protein n=1 Tax=Reyranella sp. TaxID=1929291 RepID=UPI0037836752